jgi:hypothetical protein
MINIVLISLITFFGLLSVVMFFVIMNLLRKNEKQEDILANYLQYLDSISKVIEVSDLQLKRLDEKGFFKSDDEIGFFFRNIQKIQTILNEFKIQNK